MTFTNCTKVILRNNDNNNNPTFLLLSTFNSYKVFSCHFSDDPTELKYSTCNYFLLEDYLGSKNKLLLVIANDLSKSSAKLKFWCKKIDKG